MAGCPPRHVFGPLVSAQISNTPWIHQDGWPAISQPCIGVILVGKSEFRPWNRSVDSLQDLTGHLGLGVEVKPQIFWLHCDVVAIFWQTIRPS